MKNTKFPPPFWGRFRLREKRDKEGKKTMTDVIIRDLIKKRKNKKKNKSEIWPNI